MSNQKTDFVSIFKKAVGTLDFFKETCQKVLAVRDLTKDIDHMKIYNDLHTKIGSLHENLMSLRFLYEEVKISELKLKSNQSDLEKEIAAFSKKQVNREKYEFKDIIPGSVVMALKPAHCDEALPKHICPHCATDFVISPLQLRKQGGGEWLNCHKCHLEIVLKAQGMTVSIF